MGLNELAIKSIAQFETNVDYYWVDYSRPINLGIFNWTAGDAVGLLQAIIDDDPLALDDVPSSLIDDLNNHPDTDQLFWQNRYLDREEGEPLKYVLNDFRHVQNAYALTDVEFYKQCAELQFIDTVNDIELATFFITLYHVNFMEALRILSGCGAVDTPIGEILAITLNDSYMAFWRDKWLEIAETIKNNDDSGITDTPGLPPEPMEEGGD